MSPSTRLALGGTATLAALIAAWLLAAPSTHVDLPERRGPSAGAGAAEPRAPSAGGHEDRPKPLPDGWRAADPAQAGADAPPLTPEEALAVKVHTDARKRVSYAANEVPRLLKTSLVTDDHIETYQQVEPLVSSFSQRIAAVEGKLNRGDLQPQEALDAMAAAADKLTAGLDELLGGKIDDGIFDKIHAATDATPHGEKKAQPELDWPGGEPLTWE